LNLIEATCDPNFCFGPSSGMSVRGRRGGRSSKVLFGIPLRWGGRAPAVLGECRGERSRQWLPQRSVDRIGRRGRTSFVLGSHHRRLFFLASVPRLAALSSGRASGDDHGDAQTAGKRAHIMAIREGVWEWCLAGAHRESRTLETITLLSQFVIEIHRCSSFRFDARVHHRSRHCPTRWHLADRQRLPTPDYDVIINAITLAWRRFPGAMLLCAASSALCSQRSALVALAAVSALTEIRARMARRGKTRRMNPNRAANAWIRLQMERVPRRRLVVICARFSDPP